MFNIFSHLIRPKLTGSEDFETRINEWISQKKCKLYQKR